MMDRVRLLPRLNEIGVLRVHEAAGKDIADPETAMATLGRGSPYVWYAASGGAPSTRSAESIAEGLRELATSLGFPENRAQHSRALFDAKAAKFLGCHAALATGEALRDDVWAFLSSMLLGDVVAWRFPDKRLERFMGGVRNTFQRLWMRGVTLDLGPEHPERWVLLDCLTEDAFVQIFERASISCDGVLARMLAFGWMETSKRVGRNRMENIMRKTIKALRIRNEIVDLGSLQEQELWGVVIGTFSWAAQRELDISVDIPVRQASS